jgi:hypothetical protein
MRMFELRFLCKHGEASFRIARLESAGKGTHRATLSGALSFASFFGQAKKEARVPGGPGQRTSAPTQSARMNASKTGAIH